MGTFHRDAHALHGITCVLDTPGPRLYVGRLHEADGTTVLLHDADVFEERPGGPTKAAWLARAAQVGVWPRHRTLSVPVAEVSSLRRLGDVAAAGA